MNFNKHSDLDGRHAFFSPSQSAWLRYSEEKIFNKMQSEYRAMLGTEIHEFVASQISLGIKVSNIKNLTNSITTYIYCKYSQKEETVNYGLKLIRHLVYLPKEVFDTIKIYINDAIGFKMTPEQKLYYSDNCFGTTDAIAFRKNLLRIHDLKTGATPVHIEQLEVYAALFCLEYNIKPSDIEMELRIYQSGDILYHNPTTEDIVPIMDKIITNDKIITKLTSEEV